MKKSRLIFYIIFSAFHLFIFFFSLYVDSEKNNIQFLLSLQSKIWLMKYGSLIGIILLATDLAWDWTARRSFKNEKDKLNHEIDALKAKLFDMQEARREIPVQKTTDITDKR